MMDAASVVAVLDALEEAGIAVVVNGGWGIDALLYRMEDGTDWIWPPGSFSGTGQRRRAHGRVPQLRGPSAEHTGYGLDETDRRDVALLQTRSAK